MRPRSDGRPKVGCDPRPMGLYEARGKIYYKTKFLHWGIKGLI